jgi:hypothetical protein
MQLTGIESIVLTQRFWARVRKADGDACWEWQGTIDEKGYGRLSVGRKMPRAHRISYEINVGPIPVGLCICHRCDNRRCVRADHLFAGTVTDNNRDMGRKGRAKWTRHPELTRGSRNPQAKLTEGEVLAIRSLLESGERRGDLAASFGVSVQAIHHIAVRRRWRHV